MKKDSSIGFNPSDPTTFKIAAPKIPSPAERSAMNLRALMLSKDGDEKCILCKAADELEKTAIKPNTGSLNWALLFLTMMLASGFGDTPNISPEVMKDIMDAIGKDEKREDKNDV